MDRFVQDVRFAFASIRRRPLIAGAVILTLGLGIGANAAIFRAFSAAFLRPLPFSNEERLVRLFLANPDQSAQLSPQADVFLAVRQHARSFSGVAGQRFNDFTLVASGGDPERIAGIEVSEGWSGILGIEPVVGRTFTPDEERQGSSSGVVLVSHSAWQSRFGGTPDALGSVITLNGRPFSIVGVLPPNIRFPYESDVWVPTRFDEALEATWGLNIIARLADGVTHAQMSSELEALTQRIPEVRALESLTLIGVPLREVLIDDDGTLLVAISIAVAFLLLLVTVNVANLLVAHSLSRRREFAIRTALGAGLRRHLQQTMTEGLVLAMAGAVIGLAVAWGASSLLAFLVPGDFRYVMEGVPFDWTAVAFAFGLALVTGCAFGAIPALRVARKDPNAGLHGGARAGESRSAARMTALMTVAQIALALILLTAAHAMMRDFQRRADRDLGYDPSGLLTLSVVLPDQRYPGEEERNRFYDAVVEQIAAVPGVTSSGTVNLFPAAGQGSIVSQIEAEGVESRSDAPVMANNRMVHGDLMDAMGLRLLRGRFVSREEMERGAPVVVLSRSLATTLWGSEDPLGKRIKASRSPDAPWLEVVGVVDDLQEFYAETSNAIYAPVNLYTDIPLTAQMVIVARVSAAEGIAAALRDAVHTIDAELAVFDVYTADELYAQSLTGRRSARTLTLAFALLGLIVASIGVYASMAFSMARRMREIAVRRALGGSRSALSRQYLGRAAVMVLIGLVTGLAGVFVLARAWGGVVTETDPLSAGSLATAVAILGAVALTAAWIPLRRALELEPSAVLRIE